MSSRITGAPIFYNQRSYLCAQAVWPTSAERKLAFWVCHTTFVDEKPYYPTSQLVCVTDIL